MSRRLLLPMCALVLLAGSASADVTLIDSCDFTITSPGEYHVAQDLTCGSGDAIFIASSDVELHLDGHTLTGIPPGGLNPHTIAIQSDAHLSNISIFGSGTITGFSTAILLHDLTGGRIVNVTTSGNYEVGIVVERSTGVSVTSNTANMNVFVGIRADLGSGNIIRANQVDSNGLGILSDDDGNLIQANKAHNNRRFDLFEANPSCGSDTWKSNQFGTANQSCIQ